MNKMSYFPIRTGRADWTRRWGAGLVLAAASLLAGCGGPAQATPTAIPASVVRPVQPTPAYPERVSAYTLLTPGTTPQFVSPAADEASVVDAASGAQRVAIALYIQNQTPSAVGIAPGGAAIYAERGGRSLAAVPVGGVLTITGKSADGAWYAVYNDAAVYGWTPAGQLRVFGADDLVVVEEAPDPAPIATLLAQAAEPVAVLDDWLVQFGATATALAQQPATATPSATPVPPTAPPVAAAATAVTTPEPAALLATPTSGAAVNAQERAGTPAPGGATGVVTSEGRLNLRTAPDTAATIVRKLDPGAAVTILERNAENTWLRVQTADGAIGWVAAEFVSEQ